MGYRGADLDLRTSRTWSATSTDIMSGFDGPAAAPGPNAHGHGAAPIWVDETLLACANHAFDVALAHRASEVRLEHLLHALTRVGAAIAQLEARGVRVVALRRDSALVIASEIPIGLPEGSGRPRRSAELEDVLRLASDQAAHDSRPAGVEDVLHVLIDLRNDIRGNELLLRHLPRVSRNFWSPFGPAQGAPYAGEVHYGEAPEPERLLNSAANTHLARPVRRSEQQRPAEYTILQGMLERLAEIERAMSERLEAVEAALASAMPAATLELQAVTHRIDAIEGAVHARDSAGDEALKERLEALERTLAEERAEKAQAMSTIAAEVKALTAALGCGGAGDTNQASIAERLQLLGADLERQRAELGAELGASLNAGLGTSLGDRIGAVESAYAEDLAEVHEALMKLNVNQHTLAGSIDQWRSNEAGEIHLINARIGAVQEDGARRLEMLQRLCRDMEALALPAADSAARGLGFRRWLFGTDDWIKASWQKRTDRKA